MSAACNDVSWASRRSSLKAGAAIPANVMGIQTQLSLYVCYLVTTWPTHIVEVLSHKTNSSCLYFIETMSAHAISAANTGDI